MFGPGTHQLVQMIAQTPGLGTEPAGAEGWTNVCTSAAGGARTGNELQGLRGCGFQGSVLSLQLWTGRIGDYAWCDSHQHWMVLGSGHAALGTEMGAISLGDYDTGWLLYRCLVSLLLFLIFIVWL